MAAFLFHCCGIRARKSTLWTMNEKAEDSVERYSDNPTLTRKKTVTDVLAVLQGPTPTMLELKTDVANIIRASGWCDGKMAEMLFIALDDLLHSGSELAAPMQDMLDKVLVEAKTIKELAVHFKQKHPLAVGIVCAIVALGCLYLLWPAVLEIMGFGAEGPVAESFAAWWQSVYGDIPYGSLFSYLQRLGMLAK